MLVNEHSKMNSFIIKGSFLLLILVNYPGVFSLENETQQQDQNSTLRANVCEPNKWRLFKIQFNKEYDGKEEESRRRAIFCQRLRLIEKHNSNPEAAYELGVNQFIDKTREELAELAVDVLPRGWIAARSGSREELTRKLSSRGIRLDIESNVGELPQNLDWSLDPSRVSGARSQGHCGSCWAFALAGLLEGQQKAATKVVPLSEQNLLDCSPPDCNCDRGDLIDPLLAIRRQGGVMRRDDYPYVSGITLKKGVCRFNESLAFPSTKDLGEIFILPEGDESYLMKTLAQYGPIAVVFHVSEQFIYYTGGIYEDDRPVANRKPNHALLLVGYGVSATGKAYWKVKNSWGENWGEGGFARVAKDTRANSAIADCSVILLPHTDENSHLNKIQQ